MTELRTGADAVEIAFDAYGVRILLSAPRTTELDRLSIVIPPGSRACPVSTVQRRWAIVDDQRGMYGVSIDGADASENLELAVAIGVIEAQLQEYMALNAVERIFVHAGVVGHQGRAIVLPGYSFAGKTTLVAALVRAGATYLSDEFAPLDHEGFVHPHPRPLTMRSGGDHHRTSHDVRTLGGTAGEERLPVGLVVLTTYVPGTTWQPDRLSAGAGALGVLSHTVPARDRSEECVRVIAKALREAVVLQGDRGEADDLAPLLLESLNASSSAS